MKMMPLLTLTRLLVCQLLPPNLTENRAGDLLGFAAKAVNE